jgi:diacylglycerol kinase (ATP)
MIVPPPTTPEPPQTAPQQPEVSRASTLLSSFRFAFAGLGYLLWSQRNAKIHVVLGLAAVALGFLLRITRSEWLALVLTITLVLTAEGVNTAVEATVDLASPEYHPLAKVAKDVAAGTVLLTAIASLIIGLIVFLPRLLALVLN